MPECDVSLVKPAGQQSRDTPAPISVSAPMRDGICVVGIGASAGGLDAAKRFLATLPATPGMAFILVQHLDPTHESMLVNLLADVTAMPVLQATDGMILEADHIYVIPPGAYLALRAGALHLTAPLARHGVRLPFDFLLHSLASAAGQRAVCVILSGSGTDGTVGLKAIKATGGLVIVQDPNEAEYGGMPQSAISGGDVDFVLPVDAIAAKLIDYGKPLISAPFQTGLVRIIDVLRTKTAHDFTLYKPGTLERRIMRRMALLGMSGDDTARYLEILENDGNERDRLTEDLLINVTSFFRDPKIFEILATTIIPELVAAAVDRPIRIWVAGCSSGEETYSLAMLFKEQIIADKSMAKLQIFASDVDPHAVSSAREGVYPASIAQSLSKKRLARFFIKEERGYRVSSELRGSVVFAVQDVLADPPFSKLDFVSCRNLLIYLQPVAQNKVISVINFALRNTGVLLLGSAEAVNALDGRFAVISKPARLYRKVAANGPADMQFSVPGGELIRMPSNAGIARPAPRHVDVGEFCKRLVLENHSPASILINPRFECLYSFGPTERYLRVAQGYPSQDLQAMLQPSLRVRVRAAVKQAIGDNIRVIAPGGRFIRDGNATPFDIDVQPVTNQGEKLLLVCFVDQKQQERPTKTGEISPGSSRTAELGQELREARAEIETLVRSLELSNQEQMATNEEALSINEEFQSTNEELMTSKEELQSLNEELTALNSQLQETLDRSRTTSNDLQNVLYSTNIATLFLDNDLNIRFFTPATRTLFTVIPSDVGRPLGDLQLLAEDRSLLDDARHVVKNHVTIECDVEGKNGDWFNRRILPYRTQGNGAAGIVITFTDITQRRNSELAVTAAQLDSERANATKSHFLAAASHDLRQPLQTLTLLSTLLGKLVEDDQARKLLDKMDETTNSMGSILNTLLDINQIDSGIIKAQTESFEINDLLRKLDKEFADVAEARGLRLRVVPCSLSICSDPRIFEQMIRNLLSNAMKYTKQGGVLLGCRRHQGKLSIEVWDSGLGIPQAELGAIFDEYHQVDNIARERSRGLGLGLAIVRRLGDLLGHRVAVRSTYGKGSVFSIEVEIAKSARPISAPGTNRITAETARAESLKGSILVIEDDPDIRELLEIFLTEKGHAVATAHDGDSALKLAASGAISPDLIIADYSLPNGANGLQVVAKLRAILPQNFSVIVCTGDISTETLKNIAQNNSIRMSKPVKLADMNGAIQHMLAARRAVTIPQSPAQDSIVSPTGKTICIIDDDAEIRSALHAIFLADGQCVESFSDGEAFLRTPRAAGNACLLVDANLPGMSGLELIQKLAASHSPMPAIMITGQGDIKMAVQAIKAGAFDFIEKPVRAKELINCVRQAFEQSKDSEGIKAQRMKAEMRIAALTGRQRQIMDLVLAGHANKNIASDLGISQRTVENHRATIMEKTGAKSLPALARLAMTAARNEQEV